MKKILLFIIVIFLFTAGLAGFLGFTETGVRQAVNIATRLSGGNVSVKNVSGTLLSGLKIEQLGVKTPQADISIFACSYDWQPVQLKNRELVVSSLTGSGVEIRLKKSNQPVRQKRPADLESFKLTLPLSLFVERIDISNLTVWNQRGEQLSDIDKLGFGLKIATDNICINELSLSSSKYAVEFDGCMSNRGDRQIDSHGTVTLYQESHPPVSAQLVIHGDVRELSAKAELLSPSTASADITLYNLTDKPSWDAVVDLPLLDLEDVDLGGATQGELSLQAGLNGDLDSYRGNLQGQVNNLRENSFSFVVDVDGNSKEARLTSAEIISEFGSVNLTDSTVGWEDQIGWDVRAAVDNFHITAAGSAITANGDISSIGSFDPGKNMNGELVINSYTLGIDERLMSGDARISFDESTINIEQLEINGERGGFKVGGHLGFAKDQFLFQPPLNWQVDIEAKGFDPSLIFADYPGEIDGRIESTGSWDQSNLTGQAEIRGVTGVVRELPLEASGLVVAKDQSIEIRNVTLNSGDSEIDVSGIINEVIDLSAYISSPDIGQFFAGAEGALDIRGAVKGETDDLQIDLDIDGKDILFRGLALAHLTGRIGGHLSEEKPLAGTLAAAGLIVDQREIGAVQVSFDGTTSAHAISVQSEMTKGSVNLALNGSLGDDQVWSGHISDTSLSLEGLGLWRQPAKADLVVSTNELILQPFCLKNNDRTLCVELNVDEQKNWATSADISNVDLELVNILLGVEGLFTGVANGSLAASGQEKEIWEGDLEVSLSDAGVADPQEYLWAEFLQFSRINLSASLVDQQVVGSLDVQEIRGNRVSGEIFIEELYKPDLTPGEAKLSGTLHLTGPNLATVPPITAYYVYPTGTLTGDFALSGSLFAPIAKGDLDLVDGQIDFPAFGATLKDVLFGLRWNKNTLYITGEGTSGEGRLYADGSLIFNPADFYGEFNFSGQDIDTFDLPEYEITTSPDLRLIFDTEGGILLGDLYVPKALISPERMSNSLSKTGDVVYVDEELDADSGDWIFKILIGVNLGDDVKLDSFGIKGDLEGNLQVEKMGGDFTTGRGELSLQEGTFSIYGRSMDIERGRVFFSGGPIEDPGFDVRAQKVVSSQSSGAEGVKVGVDVSGTAEDLEFNLFSDPYMQDSDILAYMVIGRPMSGSTDSEENILSSAAMALGLNRGTGLIQDLTSMLPVDDVYFDGDSSEEDVSLVVGKNLTRELFVGYNHNFFDQQGEVTIRYDLGKGFYVESRTSAEATGADILYSFER